jgi:lysophospholipase L1-like esterase
VALGDSYTAGPDLPDPTGATAGCEQSGSSYPYRVARSLRLNLTDLSCSGATIASLSAPQVTADGTNPAQLSALSAATTLVTLGIGGNDIGWSAVITRCTELDLIPALLPGGSAAGLAPCQDYYTVGGTDQIQRKIRVVAGNLTEALARIAARAPHARVYVVGYPDLLPAAGGTCARTLGLTQGDVTFLDEEEGDSSIARCGKTPRPRATATSTPTPRPWVTTRARPRPAAGSNRCCPPPRPYRCTPTRSASKAWPTR